MIDGKSRTAMRKWVIETVVNGKKTEIPSGLLECLRNFNVRRGDLCVCNGAGGVNNTTALLK